jgi:hypothetical protein
MADVGTTVEEGSCSPHVSQAEKRASLGLVEWLPESLLSKCEALSSNPILQKKEKKTKDSLCPKLIKL